MFSREFLFLCTAKVKNTLEVTKCFLEFLKKKKNDDKLRHAQNGMKQDQFARLEQFKAHIGKSYNAIARELELKNPQVFYDIKAGKSSISYELAMLIQEKFFISSSWLLTGEGEMLSTTDSPEAAAPPADKLTQSLTTLIDTNATLVTTNAQLVAQLADLLQRIKGDKQ